MNEKIEAFVNANKEEAIELLQTLGRIPSPSHQEDRRAEFCRQWFIENGVKDVSIDKAKNVVCRFTVNPDQPYTVLMAHTDIVFADEEELPMTREGNILRAPGIGDDTANLVHLMMATRYLVQHASEQKKNLLIVANSCEEGLGNLDGAKQIFRDYEGQIEAFYSFDGSLGFVTNVPVGSHRYKITVETSGGHSYANFGNDNAIRIAADIIEQLYAIKQPEKVYTTYNVGVIQGGSTVNSIAQKCWFLYEYRSASDECLQIMQKNMQEVIDSFTAAKKRVLVELLGVRPGMGTIDQAALEAFTEESKKLIQEYYDGQIYVMPGSTDANIPLSQGVLANTVGTISGSGAHTREEWVDLDSVPTGMRVVLNFLLHSMQ